MGLGDIFKKGAGFVGDVATGGFDALVNSMPGNVGNSAQGINSGKMVRQGVGALISGEGLSGVGRETLESYSERADHPVGTMAQQGVALNNFARAGGWATQHPGEALAAGGAVAGMIKDHPGQAWDAGFEVGRNAAKDFVKPENLAETAVTFAATSGIGGLGASGSRLATSAAEAAPELEAGISATSKAASVMSKANEGLGRYDSVLGTGEATLAKKLMHPVNTFVTQPIKDKAAQALLDVGGDAGALRQGAAMALQGSGVQPKALTGLSTEAAEAQQLMRRVKAVQGRSAQFQSGSKAASAVANPVGTAKSLAMGHKQELVDYAMKHPQEADKALQTVTGRQGGIGPSGLQRVRDNITTAESGGGGGYEPPQVQATTGGGGEEPTPQSLSTSQFMQPQPAMQPLQQPSSSQPSSAYQSGRGFSPNQGMPPVSQPAAQPDRALSWTRTLGMTALSYHSQKRFWEGPNREVFRGIDANHDWRHIEQRNNQISFKVHPVMMARPGAGEGNVGAEGDPSNMREPRNDGKPQPSLSASVAEPYTAMGQQPEGALNPAMPRMIQPSTRSAMFKSGSVFDRNPALPSLSQPLSRPSDPYGISSSLAEINRNAEEMMPDVTAGGLLRAGAQAMKNRRGANDVLGV